MNKQKVVVDVVSKSISGLFAGIAMIVRFGLGAVAATIFGIANIIRNTFGFSLGVVVASIKVSFGAFLGVGRVLLYTIWKATAFTLSGMVYVLYYLHVYNWDN